MGDGGDEGCMRTHSCRSALSLPDPWSAENTRLQGPQPEEQLFPEFILQIYKWLNSDLSQSCTTWGDYPRYSFSRQQRRTPERMTMTSRSHLSPSMAGCIRRTEGHLIAWSGIFISPVRSYPGVPRAGCDTTEAEGVVWSTPHRRPTWNTRCGPSHPPWSQGVHRQGPFGGVGPKEWSDPARAPGTGCAMGGRERPRHRPACGRPPVRDRRPGAEARPGPAEEVLRRPIPQSPGKVRPGGLRARGPAGTPGGAVVGSTGQETVVPSEANPPRARVHTAARRGPLQERTP